MVRSTNPTRKTAGPTGGRPKSRRGRTALIRELERLHNDLLYLMECLLEDLRGEFKYELFNTLQSSRESRALSATQRQVIVDALTAIDQAMRAAMNGALATNLLIRLRRRLWNTLRTLRDGRDHGEILEGFDLS
jgi:hypothetical protein